ncbi:MAG: T9SS type A sorting domain-containing protein [Bacteroidota bacterium]|jgi:hypothetical protein
MRNTFPLRGSKILLLAGMLVLSAHCISQNPSVKVFEDWNTTSGTQNNFQRSIVRSKSLGGAVYYYTAGSTLNSSGNYDIFIQKKNASGMILWTQTYSGAGNGNDNASDVQIDAAGNVYICGTYYKDATDSNNAVIIKYNSAGTHKWTQTYNGAGSRHDALAAMQVGGNAVVVVGTTWKNSTDKYDFLVMRYDSSGNQVWTQTWDHNDLNDIAVNLWNNGTKIYIAGGAQSATTTYKYAVVNIKGSDGSIQGSTVTGGTAFGFDQLTDIQYDAIGYIYLTGGVINTGTIYDIKTVKLDTALNIIWSATYASSGAYNDVGTGLAIDQVGNVIVTGYRTSATTGKDYVTIKYSSGGTQRWVSTFDGGVNAEDSATCVVVNPTDTNKIYVSGFSYYNGTKDYWTVKYDGLGNLKWDIGFNHLDDRDDWSTAIALDSLGNVIVSGQNQMKDGTFEYTTVKYIEKSTLLPMDTVAMPFTNYQFTENRGQLIHTDTTLAPEVKFYTLHRSPQVYFSDTSMSYVLRKNDTIYGSDSTVRVDMKFVNDNAETRIRPLEVRENYYNFFEPHCSYGVGHVQNYDKLVSFNVWNNVDIIYGSNLNGLKYYFICKPGGGGNPAALIDLEYEGADSVKIDGSGRLIIYTKLGNVIQPKAAAWQLDANGNYLSLSWQPSYTLLGTNEVGFTNFGSYNSALPLLIAVDWGYKSLAPPTNWYQNNVWSTFMEGLEFVESGVGASTTASGHLITTGTTMSWNYPVGAGYDLSFSGAQDAYVTRFNQANNVSWSTFHGGYAVECGYEVVEQINGNFVLLGNTTGDDLTPTGTGYQDGTNNFGDNTYFLTELDNSGSILLWNTYFGGTDREFMNFSGTLDIDASGNIYVAGRTESNASTEGFPIQTLSGAYNQGVFGGGTEDGFIAKFSPSHALLWSTFFGGNGSFEHISSIKIHGGDLYITGETSTTSTSTTCAGNTSGAFPLCNGGYFQSANQGGITDAFIARFDANGALIWSTFFGGYDAEVDPHLVLYTKLLYVTGTTGTTTGQAQVNWCTPTTNGTFPLCNPGGAATFNSSPVGAGGLYIAAFDITNSNSLEWSTYLNDLGHPNDVAVDALGNVFIVGGGRNDMGANAVDPGNNFYYQANNADGSANTTDGYIVEINSARTMIWATHYGGHSGISTFNDETILGVAVTGSTELFVTGVASSLNFPYRCDPATAYCYEEQNGGYLQDIFCAKFDLTGVVGINEGTSIQTSFSLFPNPTSSQLTIQLANNIEDGSTFVIYNSIGQIVYSLDLSTIGQNRIFSIDIAFLSTGMYVARLETPSGSSVERFIKE